MKRTVNGMDKTQKQSMMEKMMDAFFASMTSEEKKELMKQMMPRMMDKMMEGMTAKDKQEMTSQMIPAMMSQMFGGEGGMPNMMMQMMKNMMSDNKNAKEKNQNEPSTETDADFSPWKCCPCRELCEEDFKKQQSSPII
jgi:hypothetical protein